MRSSRSSLSCCAAALLLLLTAARAFAVTPVQVLYTEPTAGTMPEFGTVPFPNNLYYDGGAPGAGDGTLVNPDPGNPNGGYEAFGLENNVLMLQDRAIMAGLDRLDGFGVTTPVWFFFDGDIDETSLPGTPIVSNGRVQVSPSAADSVFLVEVGSSPAAFVPVKFRFDVDTRIPSVLAMVLLEGEVLKPNTDYAAVVTDGLKRVGGGGGSVKATDDFEAAKTGPVLGAGYAYVTGTLGVPGGSIAGMTVFRTQTTTATLANIRTGVVDACTPVVDFSGGLVFSGPAGVDQFFGAGAAPSVGLVASGYYESPRLQTLDPTASSHRDGSGGLAENDLPIDVTAEIDDEQFQDLGSNGAGCDLTVVGTPDGLPDVVDIVPSTPGVLDMAEVPVSLAVPAGTAPAAGWPVMIVQHGLGGFRSTTLALAERAAQEGFAVIGIDAVDHGLRWIQTDTIFNFTNAPGSDGLPDPVMALNPSVNFGFFEAFSSIAAVRDNFRQTYVDLMMLVRSLSANAFDAPLGIDIDPANIYYVGISLGGLMGSGTTPYVPEVQAVLLDAAGGGLTTELFINSTIGSTAFVLLQPVFSLDPNNSNADFSFFPGLAQTILDAADGTVNAVHFFKDPFATPFRPMSVVLLQDMNDQIVPNQANEAIGVAAGFELFDPSVQNLVETTRPLPVAATTGYVEANVDSATTAALFQVGPGSHAVLEDGVATLSLVPGFALVDEFRNGALNTAFVPLIRNVRIRHPGVIDDVIGWFQDIVTNGPPGRFEYTGAPLNYNSYQNQTIGAAPAMYTFFERTVNAGGTTPYAEPTPNVTVAVQSNASVGRMTMVRSTLGATVDAANGDMPPLATTTTPSVLPFFVGIDRPDAPIYNGLNLTITYTDAELADSGCSESALFVARFNQLTNSYDALPSTVNAGANTVQVTGQQNADGVYGIFCAGSGLAFNEHLEGKRLRLRFPMDTNRPRIILARGVITDPTNTLTIDPTTTNIQVTAWEDRNTILFDATMDQSCWVATSAMSWRWEPGSCGSPGPFTSGRVRKSTQGGVTTYRVSAKAEGTFAFATLTKGGGGSQLRLIINGVTRTTSGGRCRSNPTLISCMRYDD
jgi:dienelactone hydrolase